MANNKYELTSEYVVNALGLKLFRIKALVKFGCVSAGDIGGYIEKESNLDSVGNAWVYGNAQVSGNAWVSFGILLLDISINLQAYIASSLNVYPVKGKYILYKRVNKKSEGVYSSCYDPKFLYKDGEVVNADKPEMDVAVSCGSGIHVSTPFYWGSNGNTLIAVEVKVTDIITCQEGKLRCKAVKVIGEIDTK